MKRARAALPTSRRSETVRARRQLQQRGWPRAQMALIVLLTGAAGFLASHGLRLAGVDAMVLRYPLAVLMAYAVFLLLMWLWIRWRWDAVADGLTPDLGGGGSSSGSSVAGSPWSGSGGRSGGGGTSASWGEPMAGSGADCADASLADLADGEAGLPLLTILAIVAVAATALLASAWVVWSAPVLMA